MRKRKNKRASHVGVILSFVVFVTFTIFIYSILEPALRMQREKQALLGYLKGEIIRELSADLTTASVNIKWSKNPTQNCIKLRNFLNLTGMKPPRIIVKNESGNLQESYVEGNDLKINRKVNRNLFFKIYNSSEFLLLGEKTITPCQQMQENQYDIGLIKTEVYIFESRVINLTEKYKNNYTNLREELKIPSGSEFDFSFTYSNGTIIKTNEKEPSTDIYAEEFPAQYVDKEASIKPGFINIRVW